MTVKGRLHINATALAIHIAAIPDMAPCCPARAASESKSSRAQHCERRLSPESPQVTGRKLEMKNWAVLVCVVITAVLGATCTPPSGLEDPGSVKTAADLVAQLTSADSATQLREAGDGLQARRVEMSTLLPALEELIAAGPAGRDAMLARFTGQPAAEEDDGLSMLAYALERIADAGVLETLRTFLASNLTGEVPSTLSAVTHAIRSLEGKALQPSAAYLISEMEATAGISDQAAKSARRQQATGKQSCAREFYLLDASGQRIQDQQGNDIRVGGTVFNPTVNEGFATSSPAMKLAERVRTEGGAAFDYVDPQSGVTFQGEPTRRFNCAGFAFRHFVGGQQWIADPQRMLQALTDAGLLVAVNASDARKDDFAFFSTDPGGPAGHVAVVETVESGLISNDVTFINADGPSGMFRVNDDAEWLQRYLSGPMYYRWQAGPPRFEAVTERSQQNSCFGDDTDGDGWPETDTCTSAQKCIDPAVGGLKPPLGYRVWRVTNYGSAPGGYITVLREDALSNPPLLRTFPGGGTSPTIRAELAGISSVLSTSGAAVDSVCARVSGFFRPPLASFVLQATFDNQVVSIDTVFQQRCTQ